MRRLAAALLVLLAISTADAGESRLASVALAPFRYVGGRVQDLMDVFEVNVGLGRGVTLDLKYGVHFFGLGETKAWRLGMMDRRVGTWREVDTELSLFPVSYFGWPVHHAAELCGCERLAQNARFVAIDGTKGFEYLDRKELNGDLGFLWRDTVRGYRHTRWGDSFPVGAEVHAFVGARAKVRPLQIADFVVGFVGIDLDPWLDEER